MDGLKCYLLAWELLKSHHIEGVMEFDWTRAAVQAALDGAICQDTAKYGVEYVPAPSWFFQSELPFLHDGLRPLIRAELVGQGTSQHRFNSLL